jgi:AcrR family transcriptional regulator
MKSTMTVRKKSGASPQAKPSRVRRGSQEDQAALRVSALNAAMALFKVQGLAGVTMRGVAQEVGVSAMALYRYFPNKAGLLRGLWEFAMTELHGVISAAVATGSVTARQRMLAGVDAFLGYYEARPDYYRLIFMTEQTYAEAQVARWAEAPIYREVLSFALGLTKDLAREVGGDVARAQLASDLRYALCVGYLHARLINTRYPWTDLGALRVQAIVQIVGAVENCLRGDGRDGSVSEGP